LSAFALASARTTAVKAGAKDYIAIAAVVLAIVVSLAGACIVITHADSEPPHMRRLTLAALETSGRTT
jgi:hypothetical protein